jgi:methylmalonyl-CoA mutase
LFATIAKFRAARLLLARLAEVIGSDASKVAIHAETAWRSLARIEPEVNVLRATVAAVGAIAGGAQSLTVLPFDAGGSADRLRLARNTQLIAAHEAHLERVADPGRGSGIIEALTTELAAKAWERFQHLESGGGIIGLVASRAIFKELADRRDERRDRVANGAMPLVGVNVHAAGDVHFGFGMIDPPPRAWLFEKPSSVARPVPPRRGE